jgi:hypothetical protein
MEPKHGRQTADCGPNTTAPMCRHARGHAGDDTVRWGIADGTAGNTSAMNASAFNNDTLDGVRNSWDTIRGQIQVKFPGLTAQDLPQAPADLDTLIDTIAQRTGQDHEQVRNTLRGLFQHISNRPGASQSPGSA